MSTPQAFVTRDELADLVRLLDRRFGQIERWLQVLSTAVVLLLAVQIYVAFKAGV